MSDIKRWTEIQFKIGLDEKNVPADIKWQATDSSNEELKDCKSIMLSIWDAYEKNTMHIDLWTKDMMVDEMHAHFYQTLITMSQSFAKATKNEFIQKEMMDFVQAMAKKTADAQKK